MSRLNQFSGRNRSKRHEIQANRAASLMRYGVDLTTIMTTEGIGERRACTAAEALLGLRWRAGGYGGRPDAHVKTE